MKKNKYDERQQEIRSLDRRRDELWETKYNNCWAELDEPVKHGWYVRMIMRKDISNRADADTIQEVIDIVEKPCWTLKKEYSYRWKGHTCYLTGERDRQAYIPWNSRHTLHPHYGINYDKWLTLRPEVRRWFTPPEYLDFWGRGWCYCNIPWWFWERKLERAYATHYKVVDSELESELAWIDNRITGSFYIENNNGYYRRAPKAFRKGTNRSFRNRNKQTLKKYKNCSYDGVEDAEFDNFVKDAAWWYW